MKIIEKLNSDVKKTGAVTIAFFGDSVTEGCFESNVNIHSVFDFEAVYHNKLRKMLNKLYPIMPVNIINAGIGGDSAAKAVQRVERDVISHAPDFAAVCFGLNDINGDLKDYTNSLDAIFNALLSHNIETVFMTPNMLNTYVSEDIKYDSLKEYAAAAAKYQTDGKMDRFMDAAKECAEKRNIKVCDCYQKWKTMYENGVDTTKLLANRINHPARKMHELFAEELLLCMQE